MTVLIYILGTFLVAVIVFLTSFFSVRMFIQNDERKRLLELKEHNKSVIAPIRLQAYERMAMFLERIEPNQLILRLNDGNTNNAGLRLLLIATIRSEFEHNLSQQIYLSSAVWDKICNAKEETIRIINVSSGKLAPEATGIELVTTIIEETAGVSPVAAAMEALKEEIRLVF
ncbi:MAG: hypothetical protein MJZ46_01715 [Bacteroidales bacterium]|nr:hypothetical protein [Bacteroidales bacterium]